MTRESTGADQLRRIAAELDEVDARAVALATGCDEARWQARAPGGGWSPSECLEHLVLSVDAMLPRIDAALAQGDAQGMRAPGPFAPGLLGRLLLWSIEPPYRMKAKTGPAFVPAERRTPAEDVARLRNAHDRVRASLDRAQGLALDRLSIQSPFMERVRYNLYTAFALLPVHARRHLWQAEQVLRAGAADTGR